MQELCKICVPLMVMATQGACPALGYLLQGPSISTLASISTSTSTRRVSSSHSRVTSCSHKPSRLRVIPGSPKPPWTTTAICSTEGPSGSAGPVESPPQSSPQEHDGNDEENSAAEFDSISSTNTTAAGLVEPSATTSASSETHVGTKHHRWPTAPSRSPPPSPSPSPSPSPPPLLTPTLQQQSLARDQTPRRDPPPRGEMNVLVPVKDVVPVLLTDISQAAADSLGGDETVRVPMERFCKTLESVFRTDFSLKVDRANAGLVLGGRRYGVKNGPSSKLKQSMMRSSRNINGGAEDRSGRSSSSSDGENREEITRLEKNGSNKNGAVVVGSERGGRWEKRGLGWWKQQKNERVVSTEKEGDDITVTNPLAAVAGREGGEGQGEPQSARRGGGGWRQIRWGDDEGRAETKEPSEEEECVPLLELVEELVRDAMFSPISNRDVMMSQALAAEFPTAARVRPVFGNLANVYGLLRGIRPDNDFAEKRSKAHKGFQVVEGGVEPPFEGRLLVFRRGNGVEETEGRLLLKKLDYLQSNAVGWLSQSVTDNVKTWQERVVVFVESRARDIARRRARFVQKCVENAVAFGLERDTLERFLPPANETELALAKEKEAFEEAMETLRISARRGPVTLQRYGTRHTNVKLEEFSKGGAWPPGDDSWFWDKETATAAEAKKISVVDDAEKKGRSGGDDAVTSPSAAAAAAAAVDFPGNEVPLTVPSIVLPRVTLASVLSPQKPARETQNGGKKRKRPTASKGNGPIGEGGKRSGRRRPKPKTRKSMLSRLLSRCTVKEPTYDEVVVVYFKRRTRSPIFRPPPALSLLWKLGTKLSNRLRGVEKVKEKAEASDEMKGAGLGLQLRVYRGVPLVSLNAITPDKKVEVRPQTALRLDLNSFIGLGLVLANLRFDSPVLVIAATASVIILVIRTVVGYLNARIRVESFVSRDILDKTMGSNVPVLRHLAEEAAQQKSRHAALVYAALLQCALEKDTSSINTVTSNTMCTGTASSSSGGRQVEQEWESRKVVSMAAVSRQCGAMMKACVGLPWEANIDVPRWLGELESLKILVRVDGSRLERPTNDSDSSRSLPLVLERPSTPTTTTSAPNSKGRPEEMAATATTAAATTATTTMTTAAATIAAATTTAATTNSGSGIEFYRLLDPEAAADELKVRWSELVEPPRDIHSGGEGGYATRGAETGVTWASSLYAAGSSYSSSSSSRVQSPGFVVGSGGGDGSEGGANDVEEKRS